MVLDYGCGYGAFLRYLREICPSASYVGVDLVPEMVAAARALNANDPHATFVDAIDGLPDVNVAILNGVFHVRQEELVASWEAYARDSLQHVWRATSSCMAFNVLSLYSDADRRSHHRYYGAPEDWLSWCVATFGRHVFILHDYGLYEFTMLVRRQPDG